MLKGVKKGRYAGCTVVLVFKEANDYFDGEKLR